MTYRINEGVTWSDGTQIDAADLILLRGPRSSDRLQRRGDRDRPRRHHGRGRRRRATRSSLDASGAVVPDADVPFDPETGELLEGYTYKESTGVSVRRRQRVARRSSREVPEISEDGLAATIDVGHVLRRLPDRRRLIVGVPAHVVGQEGPRHRGPGRGQAGDHRRLPEQRHGRPQADLRVLEHRLRRHQPARRPRPLPQRRPVHPDLVRRGQPDDVRGQPATTTGARSRRSPTIVYRIIGDPTAAVQALENEEIDIIQPQATADILTQLEGLADRGIEVEHRRRRHLRARRPGLQQRRPVRPGDLRRRRGDGAGGPPGVPQDDPPPGDRRPADRAAEPGGRSCATRSPRCRARRRTTTIVAENGSAEYAEVDIEGAQALLEEAGVTTPIDVRFLFADNNPRRARRVRADPRLGAAGRLQRHRRQQPDVGSGPAEPVRCTTPRCSAGRPPPWRSPTPRRTSSPTARTTTAATRTQMVDGLYDQLKASTDADEQQDAPASRSSRSCGPTPSASPSSSIPDVTACNSTYVSGVSSDPAVADVFWNFWEWEAGLNR